jgi:3-oxo-5alpha-steroid 4-dehydrogenase
VEIWQLSPGSPEALRHADLNRQVMRWRTFRPGKAAACRREAARIEQANAQPRFIRATQGVVLSTGGFVYNPELIKAHAPQTKRGWPIGGAGCDGSGLRLGQSVGAASQALNNVSAWRFITPPSVWPKGVVINANGARFCNEQVYGATLGHEMVEHQGGRAWLVLNGTLRWQAIRECLFGGLWAFQSLPALALMLLSAKKGATPEALAARIKADPDQLRTSISAASAAARGECDDAWGKSPDMRLDLSQGPYYALDISMGSPTFPLATLTLGGLVVDEQNGQVLGTEGQPIGGLFAAGRSAIGLPSSRYVSGLSLADCVFSGRRAGRAAADCLGED